MPLHQPTRRRGALPAGSVRRVRAADRDALEAHFLRLDPGERRFRFHSHVGDAFLERHAAHLLASGAILTGFVCDRHVRGLAELHPLADGAVGEAAFSVEGGFQKRGIGTLLMRRTLEEAWRRGIGKVIVTCTVSNRMMRELAERADFRITIAGEEATGERSTVAAPGTGSLARLLIDANADAVLGVIDAVAGGLAAAGRRGGAPARPVSTSSAGSGPAAGDRP